MKKILAINGSYRKGGITDQTLEAFSRAVVTIGAEFEIVLLRDYPIEFCRNCRECTQQPGDRPGTCIIHDAMEQLIEKIEQADSYILASPTTFYSATALFKRFQERLVAYAYWPWDMNAPQLRKAGVPGKKAIVVSSCAAPGPLGKLLYHTHRQLKNTAKTIGAEIAGSIFTGLISKDPHAILPERVQSQIRKMATRLD